ncbi:MAG: hypothetical protein J6Y72_10525 [Bacteroidales bacterium]|nr:hypothetical protein [Bacteroidales bacterium]
MSPKDAWLKCVYEFSEKGISSFIDCVWKMALDEMRIDELDSGVKEEIFRTITESIGKYVAGIVYANEKKLESK